MRYVSYLKKNIIDKFIVSSKTPIQGSSSTDNISDPDSLSIFDSKYLLLLSLSLNKKDSADNNNLEDNSLIIVTDNSSISSTVTLSKGLNISYR